MTKRLGWAKDSILALFIEDSLPKTVEEIRKAPWFVFGRNTIRRALDELEQEKRLFKFKRRFNTFVYRLPNVEKDKWWLNATDR